MKTTRRGLALVCAVAGLALAAGRPAAAQDTIKIGYFPQVHDAANLAIERELGSRYKLEYVKFLRYADAVVALARGDIQASTLGYATAVVSAARDPQPRYVFVAGLSRGAINLVCRKDVKVSGWADLKGKTIGVLPGGPAELFFSDALTKHGVKLSDINTVAFTAPGPPLLQALRDNNIQCMAVYEPFAASAVVDGFGVYPPGIDLADDSFNGINSAFAVSTDFIKKNPQFVTDAVKTIVTATAFYRKDKDRLVADFAKRLELKPNLVSIGANHIVLDDQLYEARTLTMAGIMKKLGFIRDAPSPDKIRAYFDYDFLKAATGKPADQLGQND
jgi:NitT/TauT family transport system substrate-binding protein